MAGRIEGTVEISGQPAKRNVVALSYESFVIPGTDPPQVGRQVVGEAVSNSETGAYLIDMVYEGAVIMLALDEWGSEWVPGRQYAVGDIVRPMPGNETGFVYRCVVAGTGGDSEPAWWTNTGGTLSGQDGDAVLEARSLWRPIAAGPVVPTFIDGGTDFHFANVTLLLHFDGDLADVTGRTVTAYGNAAAHGADPKFGTGCLTLDGGGDYLTVLFDPAFQLESSLAWTVEAWVRPSAIGSRQYIVCSRDGSDKGWGLILMEDGSVELFFTGGYGSSRTPGDVMSAGVWRHVAVTRDGNTVRVFVNGVERASATVTNGGASTRPLQIGACLYDGSNYRYFGGQIDDLRITKDVARYIGNFTLPVSSFPNQ